LILALFKWTALVNLSLFGALYYFDTFLSPLYMQSLLSKTAIEQGESGNTGSSCSIFLPSLPDTSIKISPNAPAS